MNRRDFMRVLGLGGVAGLAGVETLSAAVAPRSRGGGRDLSYGPLLHHGVVYTDPVAAARMVCLELREHGCTLVICLSHLGYRYDDPSRPSDQTLAVAVPEIDLILGGHTHTFLDDADVFDQGSNGFTLVNRVGWGGMRLGRIDVSFDSVGQPSERATAGYDIDNWLDG